MIPPQILEMITSEKMREYNEQIQKRRGEVLINLSCCEMSEDQKKEAKKKMDSWYPIFIEYFISWKINVINEPKNEPSAVNLAAFILAYDDL